MKASFKASITAAALAGISAAVINSVLFLLFRAVDVIPDNIYVQNGQPLTIIPVILSSIVPALLAGVVFYLLSRYTKNGYRIFSLTAIILLVLSFVNPFVGIPGVPVGMGLALCVMHVVVVAALLYFFVRIKNQHLEVAVSS